MQIEGTFRLPQVLVQHSILNGIEGHFEAEGGSNEKPTVNCVFKVEENALLLENVVKGL